MHADNIKITCWQAELAVTLTRVLPWSVLSDFGLSGIAASSDSVSSASIE